jgi:NAD-dependent deacetylase
MSEASSVDQARDLVRAAERVLVLTGAGVSAESGVPTFRGPEGLWRNYRPEELATPQAFARDPRLVWEWYAWRRAVVARCEPNAAHRALARFALRRDVGAERPSAAVADAGDAGGGWARIVTQNVDGLHAAAAHEAAAALLATTAREAAPDVMGAARGPSAAVMPLELHGSLFRSRCTRCSSRYDGRDEPVDATSADTLPRCARCGALLRPDVVWFGEALDQRVLGAAVSAAEQAEVCLVVGTSGVVQPAASLAAVTRDAGGRVIEVNPDETPLTRLADVAVRAPAAQVVPRIVDERGVGSGE